jgi:hypothetical protein
LVFTHDGTFYLVVSNYWRTYCVSSDLIELQLAQSAEVVP